MGATPWPAVTLSEACFFKPPKSIPRKRLNEDTEVSFVPMNDLGELVKYFKGKAVRSFSEVVKSYTYFADGDVLCAKITPCFENGKLGIARGLKNGVGFGSSEFVVMRPKPGLLPGFLYYYLSRDTFREVGARVMSGAVGHKRVPKEYFENQPIPLPPPEEQKRIVAVLDQAFAALDRARAHAEANLADAQVLFTTLVTSKFSKRHEWQSEELGSRVKFVDYRGKTPPKSEIGIRLITARNVRMGFVKEDPQEFVPEDAYKGWMTRGIPKVGDVLFTTEAPLANVAQLGTEERVVIGQRLITMQTNPAEIDSSFLKWSLISSQMQSDIHSRGTGATVLGIKASLLKKILLHLPKSIGLQKRIASDCEAAFAAKIQLEKQYSAKLSDLANLRQSLLQKAFSGQLT